MEFQETQPGHGEKQVRKVEDLTPGKMYIICTEHGGNNPRIKVSQPPFSNSKKEVVVPILREGPRGWKTDAIFLSNYAIVPDPTTGLWKATGQWIERA
jgi:hypothetical protein